MNRFLSLAVMLTLLMFVALGSVVHATESPNIPGANMLAIEAGIVADDGQGDDDKRPAVPDQGTVHHHGSCHGDHLAAPLEPARAVNADGARSAPLVRRVAVRPRGTADPALRPPQA